MQQSEHTNHLLHNADAMLGWYASLGRVLLTNSSKNKTILIKMLIKHISNQNEFVSSVIRYTKIEMAHTSDSRTQNTELMKLIYVYIVSRTLKLNTHNDMPLWKMIDRTVRLNFCKLPSFLSFFFSSIDLGHFNFIHLLHGALFFSPSYISTNQFFYTLEFIFFLFAFFDCCCCCSFSFIFSLQSNQPHVLWVSTSKPAETIQMKHRVESIEQLPISWHLRYCTNSMEIRKKLAYSFVHRIYNKTHTKNRK